MIQFISVQVFSVLVPPVAKLLLKSSGLSSGFESNQFECYVFLTSSARVREAVGKEVGQ